MAAQLQANMSSGTIPSEGLSSLLLEHSRAGSTGMLEVYASRRVYRLALRRGVPIHCSPSALQWRLGDVIRHLKIPIKGEKNSLRRALITAGSRARTGERLRQMGFISKNDLNRALKEQLRLRFQEVLRLREGRFRFFTGSSAMDGVPRQPDRWTMSQLIAANRKSAHHHEDLRALLRRLEGAAGPLDAFDLPAGAGKAAIRAAFRQLAKAHHPDHLGNGTDTHEGHLHRSIFDAALKAYQESQR